MSYARYIKATLDYSLMFKKTDPRASSLEDRGSITGYTFFHVIWWQTIDFLEKKQQTVALSTCEAEYMTLTAAAQESIYLLQLLKDMS